MPHRFFSLGRTLPGPVKRCASRVLYESLAFVDRHRYMEFMNYGWAPTADEYEGIVLAEVDEANRYCIQLYDRVIGATDLANRRVLEVGCGRGGGAVWVARDRRPAAMIGMDLASSATRFNERTHDEPGLSFVQGDALALPFEDAAFDAVINVESSHCYGDIPRFLGEVHRVLRAGGRFLYADFRDSGDDIEDLEAVITTSDFEIMQQEDISVNVLAALNLDNERKKALIEEHIPWVMRGIFREFAGMQGTRAAYGKLVEGRMTYLRYVLQKAGSW